MKNRTLIQRQGANNTNGAKEIKLNFNGVFRKGAEKPVDKRSTADNMGSSAVAENATDGKIEQNKSTSDKVVPLYRETERRKQDHERSLTIYKSYQENILRSSTLTTQITKGMEAGDDIHSLYLKSIEVIALLTNDNAIRESARGYMRTLYGIGSERERPLQRELEAVNKQIFYMEEALLWETEQADIERLTKAIKTHKLRAEALEKRINEERAE